MSAVDPPVVPVLVRGLTIRYGTIEAVRDVTAAFPPGAVGLLGRNGAGKSSILKALLGLVRPAAGELTVLGLTPSSDAAGVRARVGYMPERDSHIAGLNGYETVRLLARMTGMPDRDAARRAHEVLYLVELGEQRYRRVSTYSAGMRQKVKLAAALVHDPAVLFLDEPTNGLDPDGRREMLALIDGLARALGKSVVLSSHILHDVERVCRDVIVLERGRVVASGAVAELTRHARRQLEVDLDAGDGLGGASSQIESLAGALRAVHGVASFEWLDRPVARASVELEPEMPTRIVFAAVRQAGGNVRRLVERRLSLEDVFVDVVGRPERTGSAEVAS
ncbi:MAG: ABC transporter ATP-binding protein [Planctomycetes bacterium]|nr:ABC transporter ATP-binding protein [Planctomycetota bacterium]